MSLSSIGRVRGLGNLGWASPRCRAIPYDLWPPLLFHGGPAGQNFLVARAPSGDYRAVYASAGLDDPRSYAGPAGALYVIATHRMDPRTTQIRRGSEDEFVIATCSGRVPTATPGGLLRADADVENWSWRGELPIKIADVLDLRRVSREERSRWLSLLNYAQLKRDGADFIDLQRYQRLAHYELRRFECNNRLSGGGWMPYGPDVLIRSACPSGTRRRLARTATASERRWPLKQRELSLPDTRYEGHYAPGKNPYGKP